MIWNASRDSTRIPVKDGWLAVRVDGDPHSGSLLLCQRFRGTMDDWDPELTPPTTLFDIDVTAAAATRNQAVAHGLGRSTSYHRKEFAT